MQLKQKIAIWLGPIVLVSGGILIILQPTTWGQTSGCLMILLAGWGMLGKTFHPQPIMQLGSTFLMLSIIGIVFFLLGLLFGLSIVDTAVTLGVDYGIPSLMILGMLLTAKGMDWLYAKMKNWHRTTLLASI